MRGKGVESLRSVGRTKGCASPGSDEPPDETSPADTDVGVRRKRRQRTFLYPQARARCARCRSKVADLMD